MLDWKQMKWVKSEMSFLSDKDLLQGSNTRPSVFWCIECYFISLRISNTNCCFRRGKLLMKNHFDCVSVTIHSVISSRFAFDSVKNVLENVGWKKGWEMEIKRLSVINSKRTLRSVLLLTNKLLHSDTGEFQSISVRFRAIPENCITLFQCLFTHWLFLS